MVMWEGARGYRVWYLWLCVVASRRQWVGSPVVIENCGGTRDRLDAVMIEFPR